MHVLQQLGLSVAQCVFVAICALFECALVISSAGVTICALCTPLIRYLSGSMCMRDNLCYVFMCSSN